MRISDWSSDVCSSDLLQIHLEAGGEFGQTFDEIRLAGDAQAVGVEHQVANRFGFRQPQDVEDLWMQGRLAARDLQQVRLAFSGDQGVHYRLAGGEIAAVLRRRRGPRATDERKRGGWGKRD